MSTTPRKNRRQKTSLLSKARWAGYAAAGAATALGAHESANAGIHHPFDPADVRLDATPGVTPGTSQSAAHGIDLNDDGYGDLVLVHWGFFNGGEVRGSVYAAGYASANAMKVDIAGFNKNSSFYASSLKPGSSVRSFQPKQPRVFDSLGLMARSGNDLFSVPGEGFIGFSFDAGNGGTQYGWLQVNMEGGPHNAFSILDYAYAGVDEGILVGQTSAVPEPGSLGLLATGAIGLLLWRRKRRGSHPKA
ncbi:MAG: PEP-CTERM sorting domain-containing protein [Pirellulaceae bacterium]